MNVLEKPWYYQDSQGQLHRCCAVPFPVSDDETDGVQTLGQINCEEGPDSVGESGVSPVGVIVQQQDRSWFYPSCVSQDPPCNFSRSPVDAQNFVYVIDRPYWGGVRVRGFYSDEYLRKNYYEERNQPHNSAFRQIHQQWPQARVEIGVASDMIFASGRDDLHTLGPWLGFSAFPGQDIVGFGASYRHGFALDTSLPQNRAAAWNHFDLYVPFRLWPLDTRNEKSPLRLEGRLGTNFDFLSGDWSTNPTLRAATFHETGPLKVYGLEAYYRWTDQVGLTLGVATGPARTEFHTPHGRVEDDHWGLNLLGGLVLYPVAMTREITREYKEVSLPPPLGEKCITPITLPKFPSVKNESPPEPPAPAVVEEKGIGQFLPEEFQPKSYYEECRLIEKLNLNVTFQQGSAELVTESLGSVQTFAKLVHDAIRDMEKIGRPVKEIEVHGYTSSEGDESYNLQLSQARVAAVVGVLQGQGVVVPVKAVGHGEDPRFLKFKSDGTEDVDASRRTEVLFIMDTNWSPNRLP